MILVDTSVWIRFLANREPAAAELDALLLRDEVVGHEFVFGELLIGDRGGRARFLASYELMHHAPTVPHRDVVTFVRDRKLYGRGADGSTFISWRRPWSTATACGPLIHDSRVSRKISK